MKLNNPTIFLSFFVFLQLCSCLIFSLRFIILYLCFIALFLVLCCFLLCFHSYLFYFHKQQKSPPGDVSYLGGSAAGGESLPLVTGGVLREHSRSPPPPPPSSSSLLPGLAAASGNSPAGAWRGRGSGVQPTSRGSSLHRDSPGFGEGIPLISPNDTDDEEVFPGGLALAGTARNSSLSPKKNNNLLLLDFHGSGNGGTDSNLLLSPADASTGTHYNTNYNNSVSNPLTLSSFRREPLVTDIDSVTTGADAVGLTDFATIPSSPLLRSPHGPTPVLSDSDTHPLLLSGGSNERGTRSPMSPSLPTIIGPSFEHKLLNVDPRRFSPEKRPLIARASSELSDRSTPPVTGSRPRSEYPAASPPPMSTFGVADPALRRVAGSGSGRPHSDYGGDMVDRYGGGYGVSGGSTSPLPLLSPGTSASRQVSSPLMVVS